MASFLRSLVVASLLSAFVIPFLSPQPALAHEHRKIGDYEVVVGFANEPAIQGEPNGVELRVTNTKTNQPVEGLEKTLKVGIAFGGNAPKEYALRARFGQKGAYTADLIPTRAGTYLFTFTGEIEGTKVNEKFESGPGRFNDVESAQKLQFPEPVPSTAELQQALQAAEVRAAQAQTLSYVGIALGAIGLIVGGIALFTRRSAESSRLTAAAEPRA